MGAVCTENKRNMSSFHERIMQGDTTTQPKEEEHSLPIIHVHNI